MITTKKELKEYIAEDKKVLGYENASFLCIGKEVLKFQISMRKLEYYCYIYGKQGGILNRIRMLFWRYIFHVMSVKCGFDMHIRNFGKGLNIHHRGTIVVNKAARIGDYCDILPGVVIGQNGTTEDVPKIGNHVYIGAGAKVIGKIEIADGIAIGANSVVNKSFYQKDVSIAGVPAVVIGKRKELL